MRLEVVFEPGGALLTAEDLAARLPGITVGIAPTLERSTITFIGRAELESPEIEVPRHVSALRRLSQEIPSLEITVTDSLVDGMLRIRGGEVSPDSAAQKAPLGKLAGELSWNVYVSIRISEATHALVSELVTKSLGHFCEPVIDSTPNALAVGFALRGSVVMVANLIAELRLIWREEGSGAECLLEIDGPEPRRVTLKTTVEWLDLERELRRTNAPAPAATYEPVRTTKIADAPEMLPYLGISSLTWLDDDAQILALNYGELQRLSERIEFAHRDSELRRGANDRIAYLVGGVRFEIPPADAGAERRVHDVCNGALISDSLGGAASAHTRLSLVHSRRINQGPILGAVRAIEGDSSRVFAIADGRDGPALHEIARGGDWTRRETRPWDDSERPHDLAIVLQRVAIVVQRDQRSILHLVERENLSYRRSIAIPCVDPQIVGSSDEVVWITGMSPGSGARRCDLFRVDLQSGMVVSVTAELADTPVIDVVVSYGSFEALIATPRGVFLATKFELREMFEIGGDDTITGMALGHTSFVFLRNSQGSRLVVGRWDASLPLSSAGYAPLLLSPELA